MARLWADRVHLSLRGAKTVQSGTQAIDEGCQPISLGLIIGGFDDVKYGYRPAKSARRRGGDAVQFRENGQALGLPAGLLLARLKLIGELIEEIPGQVCLPRRPDLGIRLRPWPCWPPQPHD